MNIPYGAQRTILLNVYHGRRVQKDKRLAPSVRALITKGALTVENNRLTITAQGRAWCEGKEEVTYE